jgi:hypothetical protein
MVAMPTPPALGGAGEAETTLGGAWFTFREVTA